MPDTMISLGMPLWWSDVLSSFRTHAQKRKRNPNTAKLLFLRGLCGAVLMAAAAGTTALAYDRFRLAQYNAFQSRYDSVSERALYTVVNRFNRMNVGIQEMASIYSHIFPQASSWPNAAWKGFIPTATRIGRTSSVGGMAILPLVQPAQVDSFSEFLVDYYRTDPYFDKEQTFRDKFPNATIWRVDSSATPTAYPDRYGNSTDSRHVILAPTAQYTFSSLAQPHLLGYNVHSNSLYTRAIDSVIDCVAVHNYSYALESCGSISLFTSIANETDMVGIYMHPIFPADNRSALVGLAAGTVSWKSLLTNAIPKDATGVDCVIESGVGAFTFRIEEGRPHFLGQGDLHEERYTHMRTTSRLLKDQVALSHNGSYTLSFYPTQKMQDKFTTNQPLRAALLMLGIFLFCSMLFGFYDHLNKREFDRNQAVLDTKRRFVRFISHEIRTPLNTVRLGMKLLELEMAKFALAVASSTPANLISKVKSVLAIWKILASEIIESSESAVEVLNDLLNYDKIEIGTMKLEFEICDICTLCERTVAAMQVQAQQKDISLKWEWSWLCTEGGLSEDAHDRSQLSAVDTQLGEMCSVIGDSARMGQVLRNLISNALKFTPSSGAVSVIVSADATISAVTDDVRSASPLFQSMVQAGTVRIAVKDSGAGLSPQQLSEICAEGVQFNANELQAGQGSGLGLFISKGIIEQHGGKLVVTSEGLGKGVTFTIELPLFSSIALNKSRRHSLISVESPASHSPNIGLPTDAPLPRSEVNSAGSITPVHIPISKRLLVVDDSVFNRKMLVRLLEAQDHMCEQAEDGEVAVRMYLEMVERGEPPDAILMDYEMPVMNGPSATARLRELGCACLIVGVTGNVLPAEVNIFREHGADAVLAKPLVLEMLTALLMAGRGHPEVEVGGCAGERVKPPVTVQKIAPTGKVHPMEIV